jgi:predicted ATP-dependent endonuclease of OLD family
MQHPGLGKDKDKDVFKKIEQLTRDLVGANELELEIPHDEDLVLVKMQRMRLPLESFGTGIHHLVILCAALAMHDKCAVCIEEPEIHMHPDLQRKFVRFITTQTSNQYFISTHSNVWIDSGPDIGVYHVRHDGNRTLVEQTAATANARTILTDMGYKASDLLQCNGIVWVEGPSDRVYLKKWLSLAAPELVEGIHYSVTFYGGKVLAHFSGTDDPVDDLVTVLRINRHAVIMMDRDGDNETATLNANKKRIAEELGSDSCWVTAGREVENYLRPELISSVLTQKYNAPVTVTFDKNGLIVVEKRCQFFRG